jgi:hypothetical protein
LDVPKQPPQLPAHTADARGREQSALEHVLTSLHALSRPALFGHEKLRVLREHLAIEEVHTE